MMKKRFRVMAALMAMAVMAGSLTGCGGNKNAPAEREVHLQGLRQKETAAEQQDQVKLTLQNRRKEWH